MVQIFRKEGWVLNPNDRVVNAILKRCEANNGECPCHNTGEDKKCPCSDYREKDICHCNLYLKREQLMPDIDCLLNSLSRTSLIYKQGSL